MSSKRQSRGKGRSQRDQQQPERKDETIAFVVCHRMECSMVPITSELPPCLFPVCNTPALLHTLNWLNVNGIGTIYVLCETPHAAAIEHLVEHCRKRMLMDSINVLAIEDKIYTMMQAMRYIDTWNRATNTFKAACVVVQGNTISNIPLGRIVADHRKRVETAKKFPQPVMTAVFTRSSGPGYSAVLNEDGIIVHLQTPPVIPAEECERPLVMSPQWKKWGKSLKIKTGLHDSKIYICTAKALSNISSDNVFDLRDLMNEWVPTQVRQMETMDGTYAEVVSDAYAAVTDDLPEYLNASLAVVRRWLYPMTAEMNFFAPWETVSLEFLDEDSLVQTDERTAYRLERNLVYFYENVFPEMTSHIGHSVVVGSGTTLAANCVVMNSTIGSNCSIGNGATVTNCVIWDGVVIEDGAKLDHCVVASSVRVAANTTVAFGCILSFNAEVSTNLPPCRRLGTYWEDETGENFRDGTESEWFKDYVNGREALDLPDGETFEFVPSLPEEELPLLRMWYELSPEDFPIDVSELVVKASASDDEDEEEETDDDEEGGFLNLNGYFLREARTLLSNALTRENVDMDLLRSEYVSLKNSTNASPVDCAVGIVMYICDQWDSDKLETYLSTFTDLLRSFTQDVDDQVDLLFWWQNWCSRDMNKWKQRFVTLINRFLELQIITHQAIDNWSDQQDDDASPQEAALFALYKESAREE